MLQSLVLTSLVKVLFIYPSISIWFFLFFLVTFVSFRVLLYLISPKKQGNKTSQNGSSSQQRKRSFQVHHPVHPFPTDMAEDHPGAGCGPDLQDGQEGHLAVPDRRDLEGQPRHSARQGCHWYVRNNENYVTMLIFFFLVLLCLVCHQLMNGSCALTTQ